MNMAVGLVAPRWTGGGRTWSLRGTRRYTSTARKLGGHVTRMRVCRSLPYRSEILTAGPKSSIAVFKHNLIIVSPPFSPSAPSNPSTVRHYAPKTESSSSDIAKITIFDLEDKFIAYAGTFRDGVREVFYQWDELFVLASNGKVRKSRS